MISLQSPHSHMQPCWAPWQLVAACVWGTSTFNRPHGTLATTPVGKKQQFDVWCLRLCIASLKQKVIQSSRENKHGWLQARGSQQTVLIAGYQGKNSNTDGPRSRSRSCRRKITSKWRGKE